MKIGSVYVDAKTLIIVGLLVAAFIGWYVYGDSSGQNEANLQQRAERVDGNIKSAEQNNDATAAELLRAQETVRCLEATNRQLAETNIRLSESNDRLNQLVEQGVAGEQGNKELATELNKSFSEYKNEVQSTLNKEKAGIGATILSVMLLLLLCYMTN